MSKILTTVLILMIVSVGYTQDTSRSGGIVPKLKAGEYSSDPKSIRTGVNAVRDKLISKYKVQNLAFDSREPAEPLAGIIVIEVAVDEKGRVMSAAFDRRTRETPSLNDKAMDMVMSSSPYDGVISKDFKGGKFMITILYEYGGGKFTILQAR